MPLFFLIEIILHIQRCGRNKMKNENTTTSEHAVETETKATPQHIYITTHAPGLVHAPQ